MLASKMHSALRACNVRVEIRHLPFLGTSECTTTVRLFIPRPRSPPFAMSTDPRKYFLHSVKKCGHPFGFCLGTRSTRISIGHVGHEDTAGTRLVKRRIPELLGKVRYPEPVESALPPRPASSLGIDSTNRVVIELLDRASLPTAAWSWSVNSTSDWDLEN